jgi:integrase
MDGGMSVKVWVQRFQDRDNLVLQWHDPATGKRRSRSAKTADPDKAEEARADLEYELRHGVYREPGKMTWAEFRRLFEAEALPQRRPATRRKYREVFALFERTAAPQRLAQVDARAVSKFHAAMRALPCRGRTGMRPNTIKAYLAFLHHALKWAADQEYIAKVPKFPKVAVPKKAPQPVPEGDFTRLLAAAPDEHWRALLLCGWLAGLRAAEAYALRRRPSEECPWVDFAASRIQLPAAFAKAARDQWVPLAPELRDALAALPDPGDGPLLRLLTPDGRPAALRTVCSKVNRLARRLGLKLSLHPLRRGFGCRYAGKVPAQVLQKLMRHSYIDTTMTYYANVDDAVMEAVLGPTRNDSRNDGETKVQKAEGADGASPVSRAG